MLQKTATIILCILITISCEKEENLAERFKNKEPYKILTELKRLPVEDFSFGKNRTIQANKKGFYLLFRDPNEIVELSHSFEITNRYSADGEGPGEFLKPDLLTVTDSHIFVADDEKSTIEIFDINYNHLQSIVITGLPTSMDVYANKYIVVAFVEYGQSRIELYDSKLVKTITIPAESNHTLDIIGQLVFLKDERLFFSRRFINESYLIEPLKGNTELVTYSMLPKKSSTKRKMNIENQIML